MRLLTLGIGYFGLLFGYAGFIVTRAAKRPPSTLWLFAAVSLAGFLCLFFSGAPGSLAVGLSMMAGLNSVICYFVLKGTEPPMSRGTRYLSCALLLAYPMMGLAGLLRGGIFPVFLIIPTYWIGEALQLQFMLFASGDAIMVGLRFHLLVVMCLLGLALQKSGKA